MDPPLNDFRLIEPTLPAAPGIGPWIAAGLVLTLALATLLVMAARKRSQAGAPQLRESAYRDALAALTQHPAHAARDTAIHCSLVLRQFLALAASDPALYETHEEFITRHDSLKSLDPDTQAATKAHFDRLAAIKYASEIPDHDPAGLIADSKGLLATLHQQLAG